MREFSKVLQFTSFGVGLEIGFPSADLARLCEDRILKVFGPRAAKGVVGETAVRLKVTENRTSDGYLVVDETAGTEHPYNSYGFADAFESLVRIRVAEFCSSYVFIHAGAVAIGGKALILPGKSRAGKSTLVRALVENGAVYYSDEYAVVDSEAQVHSFPKPISIRSQENGEQTDLIVRGTGVDEPPLECGMVLITEYDPDAEWAPTVLSPGVGILRIMENSVPLRRNTHFSLKVLNKLALRAIIAQSYRPDAAKLAISLIKYFNRQAISTP